MRSQFIIVLLISAFSLISMSETVEKIVAIVNEEIVTLTDISMFQRAIKTEGLVDKALLDLYDRKKILKDTRYRLDFLIDEQILDSEVKKQGIIAPVEKVEAEIRKIIRETRTTPEQLRASLRARKISYAEYQDFVRTSLQRQTLLQREVAGKIKISDDEVASYFIQNIKSKKPLVFEYDLAHILFQKRDSMEDAKSRAIAVQDKLSSGQNFEDVAAQYSEDPHFSQGGRFGLVRVGEVVPALEKSLSGLRTGDISKPVVMPDGIHIFKVLKRNLVPSPELERQRPKISSVLFSQAFARQYRNWIDQKRESSYIRINIK